MNRTINTAELAIAFKRRRFETSLSLRDVGEATGISASTLSRIQNDEGQPDADTLMRLVDWMEMPIGRFMAVEHNGSTEPVIYFPHESTPEIVQAHLDADKTLTPETAAALGELFRVAYKQFSKNGGK